MGCAGNRDIHTPHLDRLADRGIRFTNFFCASPVCSPARASIWTGNMPSRHGVHDWIRSGNIDRELLPDSMRDLKAYAEEDRAIDYLAGQLTFPEVLADNGYVCGLSGKWHLGDNFRPSKGFSHWSALGRGGCGYYEADFVRNGDIVTEDRYVTNVITEDALQFVHERASDGRPFYLSVHYTAPHTPWERNQHPAPYFRMYEDCKFEHFPDEPIHPDQINSCSFGTGEARRELLKGYCAAITAMDEDVGRLMDALEKQGLRDHTLVIFTSDNGMNTGHHGIWGKGNGTFPQNMYDTSVKVPFLVSRPGTVPEGIVSDELLSHYDVMPTLLDYVGIGHRMEASAPGTSFAPLLRGERLAGSEQVVVCDEYGPVRMIRNREWKYVHRYPYGPHELYHLALDPGETHNLIDAPELQEKVAEMRRSLSEWFLRHTDPQKDGTKEPVTGKGQGGLVGAGQNVFYNDWKKQS